MRKGKKKPSQTRRHRESVAAKRRARAFYKARKANCGGDVLDREEAEGLAPWRGCGVVLFALVSIALFGWAVVKTFFVDK